MATHPTPDPITLKPDIEGRHGRAWLVDMVAFYKMRGAPPDDQCVAAAWIIEAPWAHPCWHSYSMAVLRLDRIPKPIIYRQGATHELALDALDPRYLRQPVIEGREQVHQLSPPNFCAQLVERSNEAVTARMVETIGKICAGTLSPDIDFIPEWIKLFGDSMVRSAHLHHTSERVH